MAIEGCGVSAFIVWKDDTCSEIDEQETRKLFKRLVNEVKGWGSLQVGGVEAEVDTTTRAEKKKIVKMAVEEARAHADSLWEQIEMAQEGKQLGAQGVLIHLPGLYPGYTAPWNEEFIIEHLKRFDEAVDLPIILFGSPPGGTVQGGTNAVTPGTYRKAAEQIENIQVWKVAARGNLTSFFKAYEAMKGTQVNTVPAGSSEPQLFI
jgi:dihydrodipicolinate synthase/N-acetylneuraminate lyase